MRVVFVAFAAASMLSGSAYAADKPLIAPTPAWVKPVSLPPEPEKADGAAYRILLSDQQIALRPGEVTTYSDVVFKIQTAQGLAAGNISAAWRPETDVLTVHKLLIRRGKQAIDVLASGQTFAVLRRETNLDTAILDGVLTANIQPEGLQVGDEIEFAASITSKDPVLKGHVEQIAGSWNGFSMERAHLRMEWPSSLPVRIRQSAAIPALKPVKIGDKTSVELSLDNIEPLLAPKGAPARYKIGRRIEATDFGSWADMGALLAPMYRNASVLPANGALQAEISRIRASSADPKTRAEAALNLVQERVRYVALAMGSGGLVPADAETTWSRRFGDCKGKTALLLALLHALDIRAEPVAVSSALGDGLDTQLPMIGLFDHVLVRATLGSRTYWLDGTRAGETNLNRLTIPAFGWGLPLLSSGAALVRMVPAPLETPTQSVAIRIDATAGLTTPAPTKVETILRGDEAVVVNAGLANLAGDARDRALRQYWKEQYDFIDVKSATAVFDPKTGEQRLVMEGTARMDWSGGSYQTDGTSVGYKADFARDPGPGREAPFAVPYPYFTRTQEIILLPKGLGEFKVGSGSDVDQTAGGIKYWRTATIAENVFTVEKTERSITPEFSAKDAQAAQAALRTLAGKAATLLKPAGYTPTDKDLAAARAATPTAAFEFGERATLFIDRGLRAEAIEDYGRAIALDPRDVWALANRGITRVQIGDLVDAKADLDAADKIELNNTQTLIGRGMLAEARKQPAEAVKAYTLAMNLEPDNTFVIARRALSYAAMNDYEHAFADAGRGIKLDRTWVDLYSVRAAVLLNKGDKVRAVAEMEAAVAVNPARAFAHVAAARIYAAADRRPDALRAYTLALSLEPQAYSYVERSQVRPRADVVGRRADIEAALKLDSKSVPALSAMAALQQEQGDTHGASTTWALAVAASPNDPRILAQRARSSHQAGDDDRALNDSEAALKLNPQMIDLYLLRANIFRTRGKAEQSLAEAAAVVAANPNDTYAYVVAANLYSAFHKDAEAVRAYDRAIALKPEAYIYLNRSLTRPRADRAARRGDVEAALKLEPDMPEALAAKAALQEEAGDVAGAVQTYSAAIAASPEAMDVLMGRGVLYAKTGHMDLADKDFSAARAKAGEPAALNSMCWSKATAGVALESALADCNAALTKAPDVAGYLDSRALVLLRLGRNDDALQDYNRVLSKNPRYPTSLFGRAVVWTRKGQKAKSDADLAAALKADSNVAKDFEHYGIKL